MYNIYDSIIIHSYLMLTFVFRGSSSVSHFLALMRLVISYVVSLQANFILKLIWRRIRRRRFALVTWRWKSPVRYPSVSTESPPLKFIAWILNISRRNVWSFTFLNILIWSKVIIQLHFLTSYTRFNRREFKRPKKSGEKTQNIFKKV